ncbi:TPA: hypothetical protein DCW38_03215 [candidate division WOR-3 bacterium]|uniref:Uncharacterized protein n=1 Tax=candidate division WOR-3 bacterium TaxID=2052148 RepID=A0A350H9F7_UNCW3|nr:hypothetical protein [candidate division WOR-3 bacterium]
MSSFFLLCYYFRIPYPVYRVPYPVFRVPCSVYRIPHFCPNPEGFCIFIVCQRTEAQERTEFSLELLYVFFCLFLKLLNLL